MNKRKKRNKKYKKEYFFKHFKIQPSDERSKN